MELDIRNPNPPITQVTEITLQPGQNYTGSITAIGEIAGSKAVVELSNIPGINLQKGWIT